MQFPFEGMFKDTFIMMLCRHPDSNPGQLDRKRECVQSLSQTILQFDYPQQPTGCRHGREAVVVEQAAFRQVEEGQLRQLRAREGRDEVDRRKLLGAHQLE